MIGPAKGFFAVLLLALTAVACRPSYKALVPAYREAFRAVPDSLPDYSHLQLWAAHPWKHDPSDSIPAPLRRQPADTAVDVFFVHPTTLTAASLRGQVWNAALNDAELNARTDYTSILYQASVFNASGRVFAPRYRQAHIYSFFTTDTAAGHQALETAYADVRAAFRYYLDHWNQGRPFIIASHSQGTAHAGRLLKELVEGTPLQQQLVGAYLWGLILPKNYFTTLTPCADSTATGCFAGWRTFKKGYLPDYVLQEKGQSWATNPLSWQMDEAPVPRTRHQGAVLFNFNKVLPRTNGAQLHQGVVWIERPRFPFSFLSGRKNYHVGDINLFYLNIRNNLAQRIASYFQQQR
ncbi:MAG TPA: DUF3089 domain-containing protein [Lacibacter sp.]|nr:DUF3089 domain-containing protein [Lacibacter sp.]HMO90087.1 DUF3089 domain-containing protein [Lacibacter sp.]HMP88234.1 DUF3089 domain-containing protein [Lacibacter sp.]